MIKVWLSEESEWGFKNQTNHGNKVINWALSKEGEKQQEALGKDVTELVETSDSKIETWKVSGQKVEQIVEGGGGCEKATHDKSYFEILVLAFELWLL